ncbi:MAG: ASKHA domain-containing protein [Syntrophorhabdaceae bacterium]|nr:ASKHA domain-containing protein [Syntrophorhabdaceae bacterium]
MKRHRIRFLPLDIVYTAEDEENLLDLALRVGVHINASCGGFGTCARCRVKLIEGEIEFRGKNDTPRLDNRENFILACQSYIKGDATIEIPLESRIDRTALEARKELNVLPASTGAISLNAIDPDPMVFKKFISLDPQGLRENIDDLSSILKTLEKDYPQTHIKVSLDALKKLPFALRSANWQATATLFYQHDDIEIINFEPEDTTERQYALAIDIGTTTVCGRIIDIKADKKRGARILGEVSDYNAQISYGDDVITRIMHTKKKGGLKRLQDAVVQTINSIIDELIDNTHISREDITLMVAAGNTTMTHLFIGVEPQYIMLEPYTPCFLFPPVVKAIEIGLRLNKDTPVFLIPCVASYVGGDIVAGVMAAELHKADGFNLFIDIGTNGEIVLSGPSWMLCASCSAGPALEGGGIKHGMRATKGAIEQIRINPLTFEPAILTIGHTKPSGICGSGLIDLIAEMFSTGMLSQNGKINRDLISDRIREKDGIWEYVLCHGEDTLTGKDITISEADIDNIMRAKAAMFAGCKVLLDISKIHFNEIDRVYIAGGFGHFIDPVKAQTIGLLPDMPVEKFKFIGNGSLQGASLYALSKEYVRAAERIVKMMTNIDLSKHSSFMEEFMAAMFLPHTDERLFPDTFKKLKKKDM